MNERLAAILRSLARLLEPLPTGLSPVLARLPGIRAVLWDVYGTLVISGSGDVGTTAEAGRRTAVAGAFAAIALETPESPERIAEMLEQVIRRHHAAARAAGVEFPEVDIVDVWRELLSCLPGGEPALANGLELGIERLAVEYEGRVNPVWPMPGMVECLTELHAAGVLQGIVSNAQMYTPLLFPALVGRTLGELGVDEALSFFSYRWGHAKPGRRLFGEAASALSVRGIEPVEVLYVGNDMLNDVLPAAHIGFRTGLFAGDARSLRLREGDERVARLTPDLVLTELGQVLECVRR